VVGTKGRLVDETADRDVGIWASGLCQDLIHDVAAASELVCRMVTEALEIIRDRLRERVGSGEEKIESELSVCCS